MGDHVGLGAALGGGRDSAPGGGGDSALGGGGDSALGGGRDSALDLEHTPRQVKDAVLELLKFGLVESASKPNLYRTAIARAADIRRVLEPLDLSLRLDDLRGLAFLVVARGTGGLADDAEPGDEWSHPLVRRLRMNFEQSLLVAILRQHFIAHEQEAGLGALDAPVAIEDLVPQLQVYLGHLGSDALEQKRVRSLLEQLKGYGLVSEVDAHDEFRIRPIIAHLANPENLAQLLHAFRDAGRPPADEAP